MSLFDRDWYRAEAGLRHAAAERFARPGWKEIEGDCKEAFRPRRRWRMSGKVRTPYVVAVVLLGAATWLALTPADSLSQIRVGPYEVSVRRPGGPPAAPVPFPVNAYTLLYTRPGLASAPLTIQTPDTASGRRFVATIRTWQTNELAAIIYLESNTVTTIQLPGGDYRLLYASGDVWGGDQVLFGPATELQQASKPIRLMAYTDYSVGSVVYLIPVANPDSSSNRASANGFLAQ